MKFQQCRWWSQSIDNAEVLICTLCPCRCMIAPDSTGFCGIRKNIEGKLYLLAYGRPTALHVDPIEKKPLAEFLPGTKTFSIGTYGCNLNCSFCQNYHISRGHYSDSELQSADNYRSPEQIVELALKERCQSVAFTYNEPLIWSEYIIDIAKLAKSRGLATVLVSNAYIEMEAAEEILSWIDAANFDMKGFSEEFYSEMTGGCLKNVLDTIEYFYSLGKHLEITNLVIPQKNDSNKMIDNYLQWVMDKLDSSVPLHFSAYSPMYKFKDSLPTPASTLYSIKTKAINAGFTSVYLGNVR